MKIQDIILIILFVLSVAVGLWYLLGNSPTFEQTRLLFMLGTLITIIFKISNIGACLELTEKRFGRIEESFIKLVNDLKAGKFR